MSFDEKLEGTFTLGIRELLESGYSVLPQVAMEYSVHSHSKTLGQWKREIEDKLDRLCKRPCSNKRREHAMLLRRAFNTVDGLIRSLACREPGRFGKPQVSKVITNQVPTCEFEISNRIKRNIRATSAISGKSVQSNRCSTQENAEQEEKPRCRT